MSTIVKPPSGSWTAVVWKTGWPTTAKTFRVKRDVVDWARRLEDEMVRGMYADRSRSERMLVRVAIDRYPHEVITTKKESTQKGERVRGRVLAEHLGRYSLVGITAHIVARYRDDRLMEGKSNTTVRLELALLGHLFSVAIKEWGLGLPYNPVANVRKPAPARARNRRLSAGEDERLLRAVDQHGNSRCCLQ